MKILLAKNKNLEKHGFFAKLIRLFSVPLLNRLPSFLVKKVMKKTSDDAAVVIDNTGTTHALEIMYTRHNRNLFARGFCYGLGNLFWHYLISQSKAARNRLKIVEEMLEKEILSLCKNKKKNITILSIGGGSCRAVIETIARISGKFPDCNIKAINIDKSKRAIELGKKIAEENNVSGKLKWINSTASKLDLFVASEAIDIIEMVGLLDYFPHEKAVNIFKKVKKCLKNSGLFITGNVYPNREMSFISKINWPDMYYRNEKDIKKILSESGFQAEKGEIILEPLRSHIVIKIKK